MPKQFSPVWRMDRSLAGTTTPGQSGPGSDGNKGVFFIPQISSITPIYQPLRSGQDMTQGQFLSGL